MIQSRLTFNIALNYEFINYFHMFQSSGTLQGKKLTLINNKVNDVCMLASLSVYHQVSDDNRVYLICLSKDQYQYFFNLFILFNISIFFISVYY